MSDRGFGLSLEEWRQMVSTQPAPEGARRELLDGEPVYSPPPTSAHAACVNRLMQLLIAGVGDRAVVSVQNPVVLDDRSEPRPDLALLKPRADRYANGHAAPDEILLLVEVSDSSFTLTYDRGRKASYYARSGVPECWIVDLLSGQILVHRSPASSGYREIRNLRGQAAVTVEALDSVSLTVDEVLDRKPD